MFYPSSLSLNAPCVKTTMQSRQRLFQCDLLVLLITDNEIQRITNFAQMKFFGPHSTLELERWAFDEISPSI